MRDFLLGDAIGDILAIVGPHTLILLKIVVKEVVIIWVLAHTQSGRRNTV